MFQHPLRSSQKVVCPVPQNSFCKTLPLQIKRLGGQSSTAGSMKCGCGWDLHTRGYSSINRKNGVVEICMPRGLCIVQSFSYLLPSVIVCTNCLVKQPVLLSGKLHCVKSIQTDSLLKILPPKIIDFSTSCRYYIIQKLSK